jgi:large subunit ribosomal protein L35
MPKMKTHSGSKKRFKVTGTGKVRRERAFRRHLAEAKPSKRMRRLHPDADVAPEQIKKVRKLLGI